MQLDGATQRAGGSLPFRTQSNERTVCSHAERGTHTRNMHACIVPTTPRGVVLWVRLGWCGGILKGVLAMLASQLAGCVPMGKTYQSGFVTLQAPSHHISIRQSVSRTQAHKNNFPSITLLSCTRCGGGGGGSLPRPLQRNRMHAESSPTVLQYICI